MYGAHPSFPRQECEPATIDGLDAAVFIAETALCTALANSTEWSVTGGVRKNISMIGMEPVWIPYRPLAVMLGLESV